MKQISFSEAEFAAKKRVTRRERFLAEMEKVIPWREVLGVIEPHYPEGTRGRPPVGLERMLRVYLVQQWYGLSDEGVEDAITDSQALRRFVGIDLSREAVPPGSSAARRREDRGSGCRLHRCREARRPGGPGHRLAGSGQASIKASIRSKVEHPFHIVKNLFGHRKVRYKGLKKNTAQLPILFALANLVIAKRQLLALHSQGTS